MHTACIRVLLLFALGAALLVAGSGYARRRRAVIVSGPSAFPRCRFPRLPWPVGLWGQGPALPRAWALFQPFEEKLAPQKMARGRGAGRRHFGGKTPRVRVVCTPSSPAAAAAPVEEAAPATATVQQALSPQKQQLLGLFRSKSPIREPVGSGWSSLL